MATADILSRELFEVIPVPATLIDADGLIVDVNPAFLEYARSLGRQVNKEERIGRSVLDFAGEGEQRALLESAVDGALKEGVEKAYRWRSPRVHQGRSIYIDIRVLPIIGESEQVKGALVARTDVTEQTLQDRQWMVLARVREEVWRMDSSKGIEAVLAAVRQGLRELEVPFEFCAVNLVADEVEAPVRSHILKQDGRQMSLPGRGESLGIISRIWRNREVAYRRNLGQDDPFDEKQRLEKLYEKPIHAVLDVPFSHGTLAVNSPLPNAFSHKDIELLKDMSQVLSEGFRRMEDLEKQEQYTRDLEQEIVERRQAEEALKESENRYRQLVESIDSGICVMDDQWRFALVNAAAARLMGRSREELLGQRITDLFPGFEETAFCAAHRRVMETGQAEQAVDTFVFPGGKERWYEAHVHRVPEGILCINLDITERKQLEDQLRQVQKMEAVGQLTAGMAHNFNNLLQGIIGNLGLALDDTSGELWNMLHDADEAAQRGAEIIRQLMVFTQVGSEEKHIPVDLAQVIHSCLDICRETFDRRISFVYQGPGSLALVQGNFYQLEQALINLLLNARDAIDNRETEGGTIRVIADLVHRRELERVVQPVEVAQHARIRVADDGVGMDEQTRLRVFEPFFTTKEVDKGTGLGLATVYAILQEHQGWVECESEPGRGTTFSLFLPLGEQQVLPEAEEEGQSSPGGKETVLVIDDEESVRKSVGQILKRQGYTVMEERDGEGGLAVLQQHGTEIDLVLLDLSMPRRSGAEVLAELHRSDPEMKVIIFTGYAAHLDEFGAARAVINKPVRPAELLQKVRQVLDEDLAGKGDE